MVVLWTVFVGAGVWAQSFELPPVLPEYSFVAEESTTIPGNSTQVADGYNCGRGIFPADQIGDLSLVAQFYQNGCYSDGTYNHRDFPVARGAVVSSGGERLPAYRISGPRTRAGEFLASHHIVTYRFSLRQEYAIYLFDDGAFSRIATVSPERIQRGGFTEIPEIDASLLGEPQIYVFAPAGLRLGGYTEMGPGIRGATLLDDRDLVLTKFQIDVGGRVPDTLGDYPYGPGSRETVYGDTRDYELVAGPEGRVGVLWHDYDADEFSLMWVAGDMERVTLISLSHRSGEQLAAATAGPDGTVYYLGIQAGDGAATHGETSRDVARQATLYAADANGRELRRRNLDTSERGLNITAFLDEPTAFGGVGYGHSGADLEYSAGRLGLILSRTMHRSADGLNHQGGIAAVFDAGSLDLIVNHGQTSGHSFDQVLAPLPDGGFLGIDLGDNYPRGVHLHGFNDARHDHEVVFTFKTEHGSTPQSPAGRRYPRYEEVSSRTHAYYQWSNDNRTYAELGGVARLDGDYTVVFAYERSPTGRTLDNSRVGDYLIDARNIGLIQVRPGLEYQWRSPNVVQRDSILTPGAGEDGGFYTFGGEWQPQRNPGVVWLTNYRDPERENATRVKTAPLSDGTLLVLWEKWTRESYLDTYVQRLGADGAPISGPVAIGPHVRLHRRDDPLVIDDVVYLASGSAADGTVAVTVLMIHD